MSAKGAGGEYGMPHGRKRADPEDRSAELSARGNTVVNDDGDGPSEVLVHLILDGEGW